MMLMRRSEPFSADGNLSAEGFENLLGTPSLDLLAVLMREAVQNSCDATCPETGHAKIYVRIRDLTEEQRQICSQIVFGNLPEEASAARNLINTLKGPRVQVLEIADFGTTGLGGPARANQVPTPEENADFVNFFRNVGAARDVEGRGGTYGYGKATLYRASQAHCIISDTLTQFRGVPVRRFMAAQMGKAIPGKFTGRHWWGNGSDEADATVDPVTGEKAQKLSQSLGMPQRVEGADGRGTTLMILAPHLPSESRNVVNALAEYLLWYFWPRMMKTTERGKRLSAFIAWGDEEWSKVPNPETFAPLDLLCTAMNALREENVDDSTIVKLHSVKCKNPKRDLGQLVLAKGRPKTRRWLLPPHSVGNSDNSLTSIIPERLHHVALMRPAQLVVKYEKGTDQQNPLEEWGGVFVCSSHSEVENAFAKSEPPAHDDWQPESLPKGSFEKRFVNVAIRRIREKINVKNERLVTDEVEEMPLAIPSTALGNLLPGSRNGGAGRAKSGSGGSGKRRLYTQPSALGLTMDNLGNPVGEFEFFISEKFIGQGLQAIPAVMIDGSMKVPDEATGYPELVEWIAPNGFRMSASEWIFPEVHGRWIARVLVPDDVAVGLRLRKLEE